MAEKPSALEEALEAEDPIKVAGAASIDELRRLKAAEAIFEARYSRKKRTSRFFTVAQALVGWVALAGFFANAYQNWNSKRQAEERAAADDARWAKEFARAQNADKYRAFFETSALVTDSRNPDKRLVGYALLKEFVEDPAYTSKATLMLAESLEQELKNDTSQHGLDQERHAAVVAILTALGSAPDCGALKEAARSIDKLARRHAAAGDVEESTEVLRIYVRRLIGRAAVVCKQAKEFRDVRQPIRDTLLKLPELAGNAKTPADGNLRVAQLLKQRCDEEQQASGVSDCDDIVKGYLALCDQTKAKEPKKFADETAACQVFAPR